MEKITLLPRACSTELVAVASPAMTVEGACAGIGTKEKVAMNDKGKNSRSRLFVWEAGSNKLFASGSLRKCAPDS
jgi:hypothetical protein